MNLKCNHILAYNSTHCRKNDVELGEGRSVMNTHGFRVLVKVIRQIETSHSMTVEVSNYTTNILHTNIQHVIVIQVGNGHIMTNVSSYTNMISHRSSFPYIPGRITKGNRIPIGRHYISTVE